MNVLISLHKGYGLGDGVQMSAVLRHVARYRPEWQVYYQAEEGRHQVGRGIVYRHFAYGGSSSDYHYDAEVLICLYDTWANWGDRPNTRVSSCLHECFGLPWDREYGRYRVDVRNLVRDSVGLRLCDLGSYPNGNRNTLGVRASRYPYVAIHYRGDSSAARKDLTHEQAAMVCEAVLNLGRIPLLLDWRREWPGVPSRMPHVQTVGKPPFLQEWGRDAEVQCAVISQCEAFVGIDSGPSKCASATDTPALVVWTGHHPAPFHDPADNTTHLVPVGYHGLEPVCGDPGVILWFEENYSVRRYDADPVSSIKTWLEEVLG